MGKIKDASAVATKILSSKNMFRRFIIILTLILFTAIVIMCAGFYTKQISFTKTTVKQLQK